MLKNLLKHFSKKKEDEKKTQTFQPLYRKYDRIINQQLAKDILLGTAIGDALGFSCTIHSQRNSAKRSCYWYGKV